MTYPIVRMNANNILTRGHLRLKHEKTCNDLLKCNLCMHTCEQANDFWDHTLLSACCRDVLQIEPELCRVDENSDFYAEMSELKRFNEAGSLACRCALLFDRVE